MTTPGSLSRLFFLAGCVMALSTTFLLGGDPEDVKKLHETGVCQRCDLRDADLGGFRATDLSGADLRGANLYQARLANADLTGALLTFTDLRGANLKDAVGANLDGAITSNYTTCPSGEPGPCQ